MVGKEGYLGGPVFLTDPPVFLSCEVTHLSDATYSGRDLTDLLSSKRRLVEPQAIPLLYPSYAGLV